MCTHDNAIVVATEKNDIKVEHRTVRRLLNLPEKRRVIRIVVASDIKRPHNFKLLLPNYNPKTALHGLPISGFYIRATICARHVRRRLVTPRCFDLGSPLRHRATLRPAAPGEQRHNNQRAYDRTPEKRRLHLLPLLKPEGFSGPRAGPVFPVTTPRQARGIDRSRLCSGKGEAVSG